MRSRTSEAKQVYGRADHRDFEGAGGWDADGGGLPPAWGQLGDLDKWKAKFGGLEVSDARRLRQLEDENARLKRLLADAVLDNAMLKEISAKNSDARCEA